MIYEDTTEEYQRRGAARRRTKKIQREKFVETTTSELRRIVDVLKDIDFKVGMRIRYWYRSQISILYIVVI